MVGYVVQAVFCCITSLQRMGGETEKSYKLARVIKTFLDEAGLCRRVTLEARPRGRNLGLPYIPKDLEQFDMATQRLVLIHPHEAMILKEKDLVVSQEGTYQEREE